MEAQYSKIFIDAWHTVLESFSSRQIMSADIKPPEEALSGDIYVIIGMVGDVSGQIYMSMDADTGKSLASEMLGGMEITDVDELVISAVGEMCNMIMGSACSSISTADTSVDITPPTVIAGQDAQELPRPTVKPSYELSLLLEDLETINFHVAVQTA